MIERQQRIGELKEILQLLSYLPGFIERLNPDATLEEVLMPLGWDPSKLLINPSQASVTTPQPGAVPTQPPMIPPGAPPAMEMRNAAEGARMGGARNNPMARGGNAQYSAPVGGAGVPLGRPGMPPMMGPGTGQPQGSPMQAQLLNALRFAMARGQARNFMMPQS